MVEVEKLAEKPLAFPFYAAVVISAWAGAGPGCLAVVLSVVAVEYFWAPPFNSLTVQTDDLPWFISFVVCTLMAYTWSLQRRRTQRALEATVHQRTADLVHTNSALQVEVFERQAAEEELRRSEALLAQGQKLSRTASWTLQLPGGAMQWSAQLFDLLGLEREREKPSYQLLLERLHPDDRRLFEQAVQQAIERGGDVSCEARIILP